MIDFIFALLQDMILSAIPAVGFAMVFNVPHRALLVCPARRARARFTHGDDDRGAQHRMVNLYGVIAGWLHRDSMVTLVSGTSKSLYRRGSDPHVPRHFCVHCDDLGGKNRPFRLQRRADDYPADQLPESLIYRGCPVYRPIRTGIMAVSQTPARVTVHRFNTIADGGIVLILLLSFFSVLL